MNIKKKLRPQIPIFPKNPIINPNIANISEPVRCLLLSSLLVR
jgi:hypothetical protein